MRHRALHNTHHAPRATELSEGLRISFLSLFYFLFFFCLFLFQLYIDGASTYLRSRFLFFLFSLLFVMRILSVLCFCSDIYTYTLVHVTNEMCVYVYIQAVLSLENACIILCILKLLFLSFRACVVAVSLCIYTRLYIYGKTKTKNKYV